MFRPASKKKELTFIEYGELLLWEVSGITYMTLLGLKFCIHEEQGTTDQQFRKSFVAFRMLGGR